MQERRDFPAFPFAPYGIQQDFMRELYTAISTGSIGLFESPTGACWCSLAKSMSSVAELRSCPHRHR